MVTLAPVFKEATKVGVSAPLKFHNILGQLHVAFDPPWGQGDLSPTSSRLSS